MKALRPIVAALAVLAVLVTVVVLSRRRAIPPPTALPGETHAPTSVPGKLVLFFPGDDAMLHQEGRDVPELPKENPMRVRLVVEELVAGSREGYAPALPWAAAVQAVFLDRGGNAYIDLSTPPADAVSGTDGELAVIYGTVNSVVANCPGVRRVQVLLGGRQVTTLGHLDLSRPLPPNPDLVAR